MKPRSLRLVYQVYEAPVGGHLAHLGLGELPQREDGARQARLRHAPERVGLVLGLVHALGNDKTAVFLAHLRVVARGYKVAPQLVGPAQQGVPFNVGIAQHARVGRAALEVLIGKMVDHIVAKLFADVDDVVRKPQVDGHVPGVVDRVQAAAARFFFAPARGGIVPRFHGHAHHFVALLMQQHGRQRTIDPPAHGHQHPPFCAHFFA